jgi:LPS sulfotransferase NodH
MMLHCGRVGSTVLCSSLASQDLIAAGELYNDSLYPEGNWWQHHDYIAHFQQLFERRLQLPQPYGGSRPARDASVYLFEYKPFHAGCKAPLEEAVARFSDGGVRQFISLTRRNQLRRYVSYLISIQSGIWHTHRPADRPTQVRIDLEHVSDYEIGFEQGTLLQSLDYYYQTLMPQWDRALQGVDALRLTYEDHIQADPRSGYREVVRFLGLDPALSPAGSEYARQNAWPLRQLIENFDEVERSLRDTPYAALLQD